MNKLTRQLVIAALVLMSVQPGEVYAESKGEKLGKGFLEFANTVVPGVKAIVDIFKPRENSDKKKAAEKKIQEINTALKASLASTQGLVDQIDILSAYTAKYTETNNSLNQVRKALNREEVDWAVIKREGNRIAGFLAEIKITDKKVENAFTANPILAQSMKDFNSLIKGYKLDLEYSTGEKDVQYAKDSLITPLEEGYSTIYSAHALKLVEIKIGLNALIRNAPGAGRTGKSVEETIASLMQREENKAAFTNLEAAQKAFGTKITELKNSQIQNKLRQAQPK